MEPFRHEIRQGAAVLTLPPWTEKHVELQAGMSAQDDYGWHRETNGTGAIIENRTNLARSLGFSLAAWTSVGQVHGKEIVRVTASERGAGNRSHKTAIPDADGMMTDEEDILLVTFYADCVPLYFWDPVRGVIGIAHAGWRGTALGIGREMVERMNEQFSTKASDLHVAIGPSIGACCYEVDDRVITALRPQLASPTANVIQPKANGRYMLDLKRANADILINAGIREERLLMTRYCTYCHEDLFFSYRRDGRQAGRMAAWLGITKG